VGYFRQKSINGVKKDYWIVSKRKGKKEGGTGEVGKSEYYLGDRHHSFYSYLGDDKPSLSCNSFQYLPWYVWNGDINLSEFLDKLVAFEVKFMIYSEELDYQIVRQNKVVFIKKKNSHLDLRLRYFRDKKTFINQRLEDATKSIDFIPLEIDSIMKCLNNFNAWIIRAKGVNKKIDIDDYNLYVSYAEDSYTYANQWLEKILNVVPRTQKEEARGKIWKYCLTKCPLQQLDLS
jgi:hypothetical protein